MYFCSPWGETAAVHLEECYHLPPVFPKETEYLIIVFIQALSLGGRKQMVTSHEPCLSMLLKPMTESLGWVSHQFPFDAHPQHNWAPSSSVLSSVFSISLSGRGQMIWRVATESQEHGLLLVWVFFLLFACGKQWNLLLRVLFPWRAPGNESLL